MRLADAVVSLFWSAFLLIAMLIIGFFGLRMLAKIGPLAPVVNKVQTLATPQG